MANVNDVAAALLEREGPMSTWKLQKLVYYCQAWHLVWDDEPVFADRIEAWANGPVVPALYRQHRGQFRVHSWSDGDVGRLPPPEASTIEAVLDFHGPKSGYELSILTHRELPWKHARRGLAEGERGNRVIAKEAMAGYYGGLT